MHFQPENYDVPHSVLRLYENIFLLRQKKIQNEAYVSIIVVVVVLVHPVLRVTEDLSRNGVKLGK